jgi:putative Mg2+ transporter-C (MgtC) family protein
MQVLDGSDSHSRLFYGLMTGIGFIGGGSILKDVRRGISGTATAASVWSTGALGASVAWDQYELAVLLSAFNVLTLRGLRPLKRASRNT